MANAEDPFKNFPYLGDPGSPIPEPEPSRKTVVLRAALAVVAVCGAIALALAQKDELRGLLISDIGSQVDVEQEWSLKCKDGTHGTYIGSAIRIEGCATEPTHRIVPVR